MTVGDDRTTDAVDMLDDDDDFAPASVADFVRAPFDQELESVATADDQDEDRDRDR